MTTTRPPARWPHVLGQPGHALDVEVVGRLVEHQQVQRPDQLRGQRHPAPLATGHRRDRGVQAEPVELQPGQHRADGGVAGPLVLGGEHRGRQDDVAHRRPRRQGAGLVEHAHRQVAAAGDPAGVGLVGAGQQRQQRALAAAVAADDADPLAGGDPEGDVVEDHGRAVRLVHPLEVDQVQGCAHRRPVSATASRCPGRRGRGHGAASACRRRLRRTARRSRAPSGRPRASVVDREGVASVRDLHHFCHGGVAPLPLVGGVRDRPGTVWSLSPSMISRPRSGFCLFDLRLRPRVEVRAAHLHERDPSGDVERVVELLRSSSSSAFAQPYLNWSNVSVMRGRACAGRPGRAHRPEHRQAAADAAEDPGSIATVAAVAQRLHCRCRGVEVAVAGEFIRRRRTSSRRPVRS